MMQAEAHDVYAMADDAEQNGSQKGHPDTDQDERQGL